MSKIPVPGWELELELEFAREISRAYVKKKN